MQVEIKTEVILSIDLPNNLDLVKTMDSGEKIKLELKDQKRLLFIASDLYPVLIPVLERWIKDVTVAGKVGEVLQDFQNCNVQIEVKPNGIKLIS